MVENIGKLNAAVHRNLQCLFNDKLKGIDIGCGQYDFFYVISLYEGITQKELSERLYINKSTTAKVIKNLSAKGYIRREKDAQDRRFERLYLTEKGRGITKEIHKTFLDVVAITTKDLSEDEIALTAVVLRKILKNVTEERTNKYYGKE
jgi:DNA-binding MarR family transcriptional regulator